MVSRKMPSKNPKPKSRKRSSSNSSGSAESQPNHIFDDAQLRTAGVNQDVAMMSRPGENPGAYYPGYRDAMSMGMAPPPGMNYGNNNMPMHSAPPVPGAMGRSNGLTSSPGGVGPPSSFNYSQPGKPAGPVVENGYSHSSPSPSTSVHPTNDRDTVSKMLEQNAQIILQINQAIMDGRSEVFGELMPVLNKNILYLNGLTEQQPAAAQPPAVNSMPPPSEPVPSHHSRISQSPHMLRPTSQGTPPQMSPPPGSYMANGQQQFPQPSPHSTYGHPAQQPRPQPVYSPLTQSTQGPGQPLSPNLSFQPTANGPSRPQGYAQGYMANSPMGASNPVTSQHQQQSPTGNVTNNPMPPPMNYPYSVPTRGANTQNYGGGYGYPTQESSDPNYAAMPPPQMQPKRSIPPGYRPAAPQGPVHEQQRPQGNYQSRMYMDNYAQQQQQVQYPGSQVSQQQSVQQMHHQSQQHQQQHVPAQHPSGMMQPPSNSYSQGGYTAPLPSGQYSMPSPTQQPGQFRSPAMPSPASPYGMPSPAGSTGSSS